MYGPKYSGIKTTNTNIHGSFTSRLTQSTIFQIGSFNGGDFFGPISEIYPEQVQHGIAQFNKMFNSQES